MTLDPTSRFAIVPLSTPGRAPDDAIVVGPLSEVLEYIPQSVARNDAVQELERARFTTDQIAGLQTRTRAVQATMLADTIKHLDARMNAIVQRRADAASARARRADEVEQQRIRAELGALPDPDDPASHGQLPGNPQSKLPDPDVAPEDQSEFPDPDIRHPPVVQQPIAAGLDKE